MKIKRLFRRLPMTMFALSLVLLGFELYAHAAVGPLPEVPPVPALTAATWTVYVLLALGALAGLETMLGGLSKILHLIAPRTATTLDDRAAVRVDELHDKLDAFIAVVKPLVPGAAAAIAPAPLLSGAMKATTIAVLIAGIALAGGAALPACQTPAVQQLKSESTAAAHAVIDCEKQMAPAQLETALVMLAVDAATYVLPGGAGPDWNKLAELAIADASNVKACALAEYRAVTGAQPTTTALRLAEVSADPGPLAAAVAKVKTARGVSSIVTPSGAI